MSFVILLLIGLAVLSAAVIFADEGESRQGDSRTTAQIPDSVINQVRAGFAPVESIFRKACFDCHTDQTVYPWYHSLPLIRGLIDSDIKEARAELDMSGGFPYVTEMSPQRSLKKIKEEIASGAMPPGLYEFMHWDACLTDAEKDSVYRWVDESLKLVGGSAATAAPQDSEHEAEDH